MKRFPVMVGGSGGFSIPWELVEPFERQALANHDQSLQRLAQRGGLSPRELWAVMHCKSRRERATFPTNEAALEWARALVSVGEDLRAAARAVVEAWNYNEIGQVDGELIEKLDVLSRVKP